MKVGIINKITIKNFVTYSNVEMHAGPNLNIIVGPNGTGKSTIVAAIILGLGGTPKTIGRGSKISEYIKHNCTEAKIDIELQGTGNRLYIISRVLNVNNQSKWLINNKNVSEHDVKKLTNELNIQVNNLCQFLPQDRVQDFAKMNKKELLINTQKAVGGDELIDKHTRLIDLKNNQKTFEQTIVTIKAKLKHANLEVNRLMGKVQNLHKKKKILEEIQCLRRKIAWENYNDLLKKQKVVNKLKTQAAETVNKCKKKIQPVENQINKVRIQIGKLKQSLLQIRKQITTCESSFRTTLENNDDIKDQRRKVKVELNAKLHAFTEHQMEIDKIEAKIDKLTNDEKSLISQYGDVLVIEQNVEKLDKESKMNDHKAEECNRKRISVLNILKKSDETIKQVEESLQDMENVKEKRLQILQRRDEDAYKAVLWLRENIHLFQGRVYEPIILELNVIDVAHAKYLENIIPMRDRVAFTCENREDMNFLMQRVRDELGLRINVVHSGPEHPDSSTYQPQFPIEQLRTFGFFAYVTSLITAPESIIKYLCRMYMIHNIPIGNKMTFSMAEQIPGQLKLFFSESHRFAVTVSRYTHEKSTSISDVESDGTFSICVDHNSMKSIKHNLEELTSKHQKIKEKMEAYESQCQILQSKVMEALQERQNLFHRKEQITAVRNRIAAANKNLIGHKQRETTKEQIQQESKRKMKEVIVRLMKHQTVICNAFAKLQNEIIKDRILNMENSVLQQQISDMEIDIVDLRMECDEAESAYNRVDLAYQKTVADVAATKNAAKRLSDGYSYSDEGFAKFRDKHDHLPTDVGTLNSMINEFQSKLDCILTVDDDELQAYELAQETIRQCQEELKNKENALNQYNMDIKKLFSEWMEPLKDLINQINRNFSSYFESMGCVGEVSISHESGVEEYVDYGLCIRVTYRAGEPLQELNRYVQSGGERTVATAIYMLSLQDLTAAPFRCVDEINQGMDPQNERRIFDILVTATTKTETCQYFLITPKLISGLQFGDGMKIHIVHNGPFCDVSR